MIKKLKRSQTKRHWKHLRNWTTEAERASRERQQNYWLTYFGQRNKKHVCSEERTCFFDKAFPEGEGGREADG